MNSNFVHFCKHGMILKRPSEICSPLQNIWKVELILFNFGLPIVLNYRIDFKTYSRISTLNKTWPSTQISAILLSCNKAWKNWDSNFSLRLLKHFKDLILRHLVHSTCSFVQYMLNILKKIKAGFKFIFLTKFFYSIQVFLNNIWFT